MSRRSRKHPPHDAERVERRAVSREELDGILEQTKHLLPASAHATLKGAVDTLVLLTQELESKQTSLERLRRLIFGPRTEKTAIVLGAGNDNAEAQPPAQTSTQSSTQQQQRAKPKKRKGHGRNGADDYPRAERIPVAHESLAPGDPCPELGCEDGRHIDLRSNQPNCFAFEQRRRERLVEEGRHLAALARIEEYERVPLEVA